MGSMVIKEHDVFCVGSYFEYQFQANEHNSFVHAVPDENQNMVLGARSALARSILATLSTLCLYIRPVEWLLCHGVFSSSTAMAVNLVPTSI